MIAFRKRIIGNIMRIQILGNCILIRFDRTAKEFTEERLNSKLCGSFFRSFTVSDLLQRIL